MSAARTIQEAVAKLTVLVRAPTALAASVAPAFAELIDQGFATGTDPYGVPWKPLAESTVKRGRRPPPLTATGATRASATVRAGGSIVACTVRGASDFHQPDAQGRQILPTDAQGLPRSWANAIQDAGRELEREVA